MTLYPKILSILLSLQPAQVDQHEDPIERTARLGMVAAAIDDAVQSTAYRSKRELAATLIVLAIHESHFASNVQSCQCRRYECDPIRSRGQVIHQARGLWQVHRFGPARDAWDEMCVSVEVQARVAASLIAGAIGSCGSLAGGIARYGNGHSCVPTANDLERAAAVRRMEARL